MNCGPTRRCSSCLGDEENEKVERKQRDEWRQTADVCPSIFVLMSHVVKIKPANFEVHPATEQQDLTVGCNLNVVNSLVKLLYFYETEFYQVNNKQQSTFDKDHHQHTLRPPDHEQ